MPTEEQLQFLKERLDDLKTDLAEVKGELKAMREGYVTTSQLEMLMGPIVKRVESLENRNLWLDRLVGGAIILALLGLIITNGGA